MAIGLQNRKTVMAVKIETVEGQPEAPTASTDFVALQAGFSIEPGFEVLENEEIRSSIGRVAPILGLEQPSASFDHYLRHSGIEGQPPNFAPFIEAAFGTAIVNGTERSTTGGSTTAKVAISALNLGDFSRGTAILIKDGTNGFSIRPVVNTDGAGLNLLFNLPAGKAPGSSVKLGKCVHYAPVDQGQPTLSIWGYRANGGALEAMTGSRVNSYSIEFAAGQLIRQSFGLEGVRYLFNPIEVATGANKLAFTDSAADDFTATVNVDWYSTPQEVAQALQDSMNAQGSPDTFTVTYQNSSGKFEIKSSGTVFTIGLSEPDSVGPRLGYAATDATGALSYIAPTAQAWTAPFTPSYDEANPLVAKDNEVLFGDKTDSGVFDAMTVTVNLSNTLANIPSIAAESGVAGKIATARECTIDVRCILSQHDVDKVQRYRKNSNIQFAYNFGQKQGGNWVPGRCGSVVVPNAVISSFTLADQDGLVVMDMTLTPYVNSSGQAEVFLNFL